MSKRLAKALGVAIVLSLSIFSASIPASAESLEQQNIHRINSFVKGVYTPPKTIVHIDPATGEIIEIYSADAETQTRIYQILPGCTKTSLCLNEASGRIFYGFEGKGVLNTWCPNIHAYDSRKWTV